MWNLGKPQVFPADSPPPRQPRESAGRTANCFDWNRQRCSVEGRKLLRGAAGFCQFRYIRLHRFIFAKDGERFTQNACGTGVLRHDNFVMHPLAVAAGSNDAGATQVGEMP